MIEDMLYFKYSRFYNSFGYYLSLLWKLFGSTFFSKKAESASPGVSLHPSYSLPDSSAWSLEIIFFSRREI